MKSLFLLLFVIFSAGCSVYQVRSQETSQEIYVPKSSIDDVAYLEKVDKPYKEIGTVTVTTERRQSFADVLPKLKQEAAMIGADAITDLQSSPTDTWAKIKNQKLFGNSYIRMNYTVKAIVWSK